MKTKINRHGEVRIIAENDTEAFALLYLTRSNNLCEHCGQDKNNPVVIDCSVINDPDTE